MSALRDLVGGAGASCAAPDERASSSNPLGRLADAVLGDRKGKHPEHLRPPAPGADPGAFADQFLSERRLHGNLLGADDPAFSALPGGPAPFPGPAPGDADVAEFLRFQEARARGAPPGVVPQGPGAVPSGAVATRRPDHPALSAALRSAVASVNQPAAHVPPPADLTLSPAEKTLIRNRSAIMARHLRGDSSSDDALTARLGAALSPLGVDPAHVGPMEGPRGLAARALAPPFAAAEAAADARGAWAREFGRGGVSGDWVGDFAKMRVAVDGDANAVSSTAAAAAAARSPAGPQTWAEEYSGVKQSSGGAWSMGSGEARMGASGATRPGDAWAGEFARERRTEDETSARAASSASEPLTAAQAETAAQSARLAETLSADPDAKFRSSQFLRFVSRMSRGEIVVEGDGVKEVAAPEPSAAHRATGAAWADEFAAAAPGPDAFAASSASASARWADEFRQNSASASAAASSGPSDAAHRWADEFADVPDQWAREFEEMRRDGGDWAHESVWDQIAAETATRRAAERSRYDFVDPNPYLGREDALEVGRDLFRRGVLSEAALALEAAVRADPDLCEGWRLLGTVHAENDDDRRAIAAMTRANEADPNDPEVLLSLGVSHTNELDQEEAIGHMRRWLRGQTRFAALEAEHAASMGGAPDTPDSALGLFRRAAAAAPGDADVHAVLGVLAHLSRSYDEAIDAFNTALDINPQDYSLWNKLGATQANSARSADAMRAYQRALDLKPNYVRAWANMGIGFANQGKYAESVAYYVRALGLNPRAESVWGYLRISLGCCGRVDLMEAVDARNLDALAAEFPL